MQAWSAYLGRRSQGLWNILHVIFTLIILPIITPHLCTGFLHCSKIYTEQIWSRLHSHSLSFIKKLSLWLHRMSIRDTPLPLSERPNYNQSVVVQYNNWQMWTWSCWLYHACQGGRPAGKEDIVASREAAPFSLLDYVQDFLIDERSNLRKIARLDIDASAGDIDVESESHCLQTQSIWNNLWLRDSTHIVRTGFTALGFYLHHGSSPRY